MRVCVSKVKRCVYLLNMNEIFGIFMKLSKKKTTCLFFRFLWSQTKGSFECYRLHYFMYKTKPY